jgi:hypothetical protein
MTDHDDEFDRSLSERLRAQEGRVPGAAAPNLDTMSPGSARPRAASAGAALVAAGGVALGLVLVLIINRLSSPPTGHATASPSPSARGYEAVFLRKDTAGSMDMLVVGVDGEGREREIARLPGFGQGYGGAAPAGAVSLSGLLALPKVGSDSLFHWEILDLHRPQAAPIVIAGISEDADMLRVPPYYTPDGRGGVFWGPHDQVAIGWYLRGGDLALHVTVVDGHTGAASSVEVPGGTEPYWASDGSGILLGKRIEAGSYVFAFLLPDGTVETSETTQVVGSGTSRHYRSDGLEVTASGLSLGGLDISDIAWTAAGDGAWLAIRSQDGHQLTIERLVSPSERRVKATLPDAAGEPATGRPDGRFVGLAPDDSLIVLSMDRADGNSGEPRSRTLVNPESGASFVIEGSFVGWLAVDR